MPISSMTNPANTTSTSSSLTASSNVQRGDVLIILDWADNTSGTPTDVSITGYTKLHTVSGSFDRCNLWYRVSDGTEASASYTCMNGTNWNHKIFSVFRPNAMVVSVTAKSPVGTVTDSNPGSQTITSGSGTAPLLVLATWNDTDSSSAISPRTQSPTMTEVSLNTHSYLGWIFYASSPSNQSFDMDDEGNANTLVGGYLELTGQLGQFFNVF